MVMSYNTMQEVGEENGWRGKGQILPPLALEFLNSSILRLATWLQLAAILLAAGCWLRGAWPPGCMAG